MVGAALSVGVFWGCQKNLETSDPSVFNNPTSVANPLTVDMVKTWFESNFGKSTKIEPPQAQTNSFGADSSVVYFKETFDITPTWSEAEIATYLSVNPIVIVPVRPIAFLDKTNQEYVFICFRNELNQIDGRLQVYQPSYAYKSTHPTYDVKDFTGFMLQVCLDGKIQRVFGYENGQFISSFKLSPKISTGQLNVRGICDGCWDSALATAGFLKRAACWFCSWGFKGDTNNRTGETGENNWNGLTGNTLGFGNTNINPSNGNNTGNNPGGSGGPSLGSQVGNTIFTVTQLRAKLSSLDFSYAQQDMILDNNTLKAKVTAYFVKRGWDDLAVAAAVKNNLAYADNDLHRYLADLTSDDAFYAANKQTGFLLAKYLGAGFSYNDFFSFASNVGFAQVDNFFNQNGFTDENKKSAKGFNFLMGLDDDFKSLNDNRGSKNIKQLLDEYSFPNLQIGTLIGLAREKNIDINHPDENTKKYNYQRLGRIFEDFLLRSLAVSSNQVVFNSPIPGFSGVKPDGLGNGNVVQYDENLRRENSWIGNNSIFLEAKLVFKGEKLIKDNSSVTVNFSLREQISTMIDVLANMTGGSMNGLNDLTLKPSDHGIASLYILTMYDTELDPTLVTKAEQNKVNVYKRWPVYDIETGNVRVSDSYQDKTPFIVSRKRPGYTDPIFSPKAVAINWDLK